MRVLTYNCCALPLLTGDIPARLDLAAGEIARLEPDLILLQEVFLAGHLTHLRRRLPGWRHAAHVGRSFNRVAGGLCILSRLPIRRFEFVPFCNQGPVWRLSGLVRLSPKGALRADLDGFHVVATHLVADYRISRGGNGRNPYHGMQEAQLGELARRLDELTPGAPTVLAGDLNMTPDSPMLRRFMREQGLSDPMAFVSAPSVVDEPYYRIPYLPAPNKRLDYALFRGAGVQASARYALEKRLIERKGRAITLSDHFGVLVEFRIAA